MECQCFPQFSGTNSVVQNNALLLLYGVLASNRLDIHELFTISRYMRWYLDILLVFLSLAIAFKRVLFPGLPIAYRSLDCLITFHGSEGSSDVVYNTAEVVCQRCHLAITCTHHADMWLPLQQFRRHYSKAQRPLQWNGKNYDMLWGTLTLGWRLY